MPDGSAPPPCNCSGPHGKRRAFDAHEAGCPLMVALKHERDTPQNHILQRRGEVNTLDVMGGHAVRVDTIGLTPVVIIDTDETDFCVVVNGKLVHGFMPGSAIDRARAARVKACSPRRTA